MRLGRKTGLQNRVVLSKAYQPHDLSRPSPAQEAETVQKTRSALKNLVLRRSKKAAAPQAEAKIIKYTPLNQSEAHNAGASQRIIKVIDAPEDPLSLQKFKHKRVPAGANEAPPQIMHSPTQKLTAQDQQALKVPPCVSNWKNSKGHVRPLAALLAADGRYLKDTTINPRFGEYTDALYTAETAARKEIQERNKIQEGVNLLLEKQKEEEIREQAQKARQQKVKMLESTISAMGLGSTAEKQSQGIKVPEFIGEDEDERKLAAAKKERDEARRERILEIERELRLENRNKKSKVLRDKERDISEVIALGQAQPTSKDNQFDQRLFNQTAGLDHGLMDEDAYNLYDRPLFHDRTAASIYKNIREAPLQEEEVGAQNQKELRQLVQSQKGARGEGRMGPVEFEKSGTIKTSLDQEIEAQKDMRRETRDRSRERERERERGRDYSREKRDYRRSNRQERR